MSSAAGCSCRAAARTSSIRQQGLVRSRTHRTDRAANPPLQRAGRRGVSDVGKYLRARQSATSPRRLEVLHAQVIDVVDDAPGPETLARRGWKRIVLVTKSAAVEELDLVLTGSTSRPFVLSQSWLVRGRPAPSRRPPHPVWSAHSAILAATRVSSAAARIAPRTQPARPTPASDARPARVSASSSSSGTVSRTAAILRTHLDFIQDAHMISLWLHKVIDFPNRKLLIGANTRTQSPRLSPPTRP